MPPPVGGFPPAGIGPAPVGPRPKEVELSFWLWVASFAIGLIGLLLFVGQYDTIRDTALEEARREAQRQGGSLDVAQIETITTVVLVIGVIIGLVFSLVQLLFAFFMRKGRNWARIVLAVIGGISVLFGLVSLTGIAGGQLALTGISLIILIGAIVTMFLPGANPWFRSRPTG